MALTVANADQYTKPLVVGPSYSTPGSLQGGNVPLQTSYNPQTTMPSGGNVMGAMTTTPSVPVGPTAAEIAESNRISQGREQAGLRARGYETGGRTSLTDIANEFRTRNMGAVNTLRSGQEDINTARANNALNLRRTMAGIASGVRQGLKSGGVNLANMNALDSGASEAMARAYARAGNQQAGSASNEAQLATNQLNTTQENLNRTRQQNLEELKTWRGTETARVSNDLWDKLATLEADARAGGYGGVVDMGVRDRLIAEAAAQLDAIDSRTQQELGSIRGLTPEEVQARAMQMEQAGTEIVNPFAIEGPQGGAFGEQVPVVGGPPIGQLTPGPRPRDEQNPLF